LVVAVVEVAIAQRKRGRGPLLGLAGRDAAVVEQQVPAMRQRDDPSGAVGAGQPQVGMACRPWAGSES
jgi:hypothetical protein